MAAVASAAAVATATLRRRLQPKRWCRGREQIDRLVAQKCVPYDLASQAKVNRFTSYRIKHAKTADNGHLHGTRMKLADDQLVHQTGSRRRRSTANKMFKMGRPAGAKPAGP